MKAIVVVGMPGTIMKKLGKNCKNYLKKGYYPNDSITKYNSSKILRNMCD